MRLQFVFSGKRSLGSNCLNSQLFSIQVWLETWQDIKWPPGLPTHCLLKSAAFSYYRKFSVSREYQIVTASMLGIQDAGCLNKTCRTWHSFKGWQALFYPNVGRLCRSFISSHHDLHLTSHGNWPHKIFKNTPNKTQEQKKFSLTWDNNGT